MGPSSTHQIDGQWDDMQRPRYSPGLADFPISASFPIDHHRIDLPNHIGNIEHPVTLKHLWQSVCQVAGQTFSSPLLELKFKLNLIIRFSLVYQANVIGALFGVTEKRFKKLVGTVGREYLIQYVLGKLNIG